MSDIGLPGAEARITANTSGFRAGIGQAQSALLALEPVVARQWWGLQNLSRAFGATGAAVAAGFGIAIREASAWEDAMVGVERTTGATGSELEDIERGLRQIAATTPIAASEIANLAEQAGALGIANEDIPEFTRIMGTLITSTNLTSSSVEDLARTMSVLGVPNEAFERFASTLVDVGRNTAATETDILNLARRLGPMARMAGMSADEVLGLSAAIISLGPRAEAGSSAMTRVIADVSSAISENGDELRAWARITDMSTEQFAESWGRDASGTIEQIIVGLGKFEGNVVALSSVLDHLDQANVRNIITLGSLAAGITDVDNQQTSLIAINDLAREAWRRNTAMTEIAERRAQTLSSQLTMLRNRLSEIANSLGTVLLPPLKFIVNQLHTFAAGIQALPGPLQGAIAIFAGLIGIVSLLAGGILAAIGPIVLMVHSLKSLRGSLGGVGTEAAKTKPGTDALTRALGEQAAAAIRDGQAFMQLRNAQGQFAGTQRLVTAQTNAQTGANAAAGASAAGAGLGMAGFGKNMSKAGKFGLILTAIITAAAGAIWLFGRRARQQADDVEAAAEADAELTTALEEVRKGARESADEILLNRLAMAGLATKANDLGKASEAAGNALWGVAEVISVINGTASGETAAALIDQLKGLEEQGDESAGALLDYMATEHAVFLESARAAGILASARNKLGTETEDAAAAERELAAASEEVRDKQDAINQAYGDYVDAVLSQRAAVLASKDAQQEYQRALAEAADPTLRLAQAENNLQQARHDQQEAQRNLLEAERDLETSRSRQLEDLADAEDALADANDRYIDSLDKVQDAEEKLARLREGPSADDLLEATNKLANAHLRLRSAERAVEDAEWQLAYLRGEGASQRAVEDAEFALDEARQEVRNETENVADAEEELADVRETTPEEIADAERDLASARRDSEGALRAIHGRERELAELREEIVNDVAYLEAQAAVVEAQGRVQDSIFKVRDAELELQNLRAGGLEIDRARAQLDLERALYDEAKAAVEVRRQQALMRGEFWDAGRGAHALAEELENLLGAAPTAEARANMERAIDALRQAKPLAPPAADSAFDPARHGLPTVQQMRDHMENLKGAVKETEPDAKKKGWDWGNALGGAINGGFAGAMVGSAVAPGIGTIVGAFIGAIIGALIANFDAIKQWYDETLYPFFNVTVAKALEEAWIASWDWLKDFPTKLDEWWGKYVIDPIKRFFRMRSPSGLMSDLGGDITQGLVNGIFGGVWKLAGLGADASAGVLQGFQDSRSWLVSKGADIIGGLYNGLGDFFGIFRNVGSDIAVGLGFGLLDKMNWLGDKARDIGGRIYDGIKAGVGDLWPGSPSKAGLAIGEGLGLGFRKGLKDVLPMAVSAAQSLADQVEQAAAVDSAILGQFNDARFADLALRQITLPDTVPYTPVAPTQERSGDLIQITGADERDALDIAEELMFRKMVRVGR